MSIYTVTWNETHTMDVIANSKREAKKIAMQNEIEETLCNVYNIEAKEK